MENSESLDTLALEASGIDAMPSAGEAQREQTRQAEQAQVFESNAAQLMSAAVLIRAMWLPILPERKAAQLAQVWSDQVLQNAANAGAGVLDLHGIQFGDVLGKYAPYIALVAALGPPVLTTAAIMKVPEPKPAEVVQPAGQGDGAGQQ